jgi:hypothetical protein
VLLEDLLAVGQSTPRPDAPPASLPSPIERTSYSFGRPSGPMISTWTGKAPRKGLPEAPRTRTEVEYGSPRSQP